MPVARFVCRSSKKFHCFALCVPTFFMLFVHDAHALNISWDPTTLDFCSFWLVFIAKSTKSTKSAESTVLGGGVRIRWSLLQNPQNPQNLQNPQIRGGGGLEFVGLYRKIHKIHKSAESADLGGGGVNFKTNPPRIWGNPGTQNCATPTRAGGGGGLDSQPPTHPPKQ